MSNTYYFETIKECEKEIIDKVIDLEMMHASCMNLFACFIRTIKTAFIWICIITISVLWYLNGFRSTLSILAPIIIIYLFGKFIMKWVIFNHNRSYNTIKVRLVDGLINNCKEFQEANYENWERKQMLKRFAALAKIDIDWDNVK